MDTLTVYTEEHPASIRQADWHSHLAETEEQVAARCQRFLQNKRELEGYVEEFTEEWYRAKYPGFPDEFYPVFERFSNTTVNEPHGNMGAESSSPCER